MPVDDEPGPAGPLSGTWQATAGATFRIDDDGQTATVRLIQANALQTFSGKLTRGGKGSNTKSLAGTLEAVFRPDAPKRHAIRVTATLDDQEPLAFAMFRLAHLEHTREAQYANPEREPGRGSRNRTHHAPRDAKA